MSLPEPMTIKINDTSWHHKATKNVSLYHCISTEYEPWWRHQMGTFSAILALCAGNSSVTGEFPSQRLVASLMSLTVSLVTTSRIQQCFNVVTISCIYKMLLFLYHCCILSEIKLTATNVATTEGQWRGALMFSLIWNNRDAGDLRRYLVHYDVTLMIICVRRV